MTTLTSDVCTCKNPGARDCPACAAHERVERERRRADRIQRSGLPAKLRTAALLTYPAALTAAGRL